MNIYKQRLLNTARAVRESPAPRRFHMGDYLHPDGVPSCVIGHYCARSDLQNIWRIMGGHIIPIVPYYTILHEHLGITSEENGSLFGASGCGNAKTVEEAARYIEAFVERKWPEAKLDPAFVALKEQLEEEAHEPA